MPYFRSQPTVSITIIIAMLAVIASRTVLAAADFTITGRFKLSGEYGLDRQSVKDDPSLNARLLIDGQQAAWRLHTWTEGGWDGSVGDLQRDQTTVKRFDKVYQANTPYLDLKEFYVEREFSGIDYRIGVQRISWGRLDEYPINDLFNPWDYRQFIIKPMEERKIGVPIVSALLPYRDWTYQLVWVPWFVPCRLAEPGGRWSVTPAFTTDPDSAALEVRPREPDLPARTIANSSVGIRLQRLGAIEWALYLFHGFDPRPVFKSSALTVSEFQPELAIDPGYVLSFHRITALGLDAATVVDNLSLRAEAAYTVNRFFNIRRDLWGYPQSLTTGFTPLNPVEIESNTLDYGIAADYRPFEESLLTIQVQQTVILDRPDSLFERTFETLLWANLKINWLNQKIETTLNLACNPEHGATMARVGASYIFTDFWKTAINALLLDGPSQSIFGRYAANDQIGLEMVYSW